MRVVWTVLAVVVLAAGSASAATASAPRIGVTSWEVENQQLADAFGWTNAQVQANRSSVTYRVTGFVYLNAFCSVVTKDGHTIEQDYQTQKQVDEQPSYTLGPDYISIQLAATNRLEVPQGSCAAALPLAFQQVDWGAHMDLYATFGGVTAFVTPLIR